MKKGTIDEIRAVLMCPYCGYVYTNSWELSYFGTLKCWGCGESFGYVEHAAVYFAWKKEPVNDIRSI